MSVVSDRHSIVTFKAGKTVPFEGQRLAKIGWKTTKKTKAPFANIAVSVPQVSELTITENQNQRLRPFLMGLLESAQDSIIRSLYESSQGVLSTVSDADISIDSCIAFLEAEATGERLKKEHIESWFDAELSDNLFVVVAEKLGFNEPSEAQEVQIRKHVQVYRDVLSMLAGGKTHLAPPQIKGCKSALSLVDCEDGIPAKLMKRLESMERVNMVEVLEL